MAAGRTPGLVAAAGGSDVGAHLAERNRADLTPGELERSRAQAEARMTRNPAAVPRP
jgi:hypothetical protein